MKYIVLPPNSIYLTAFCVTVKHPTILYLCCPLMPLQTSWNNNDVVAFSCHISNPDHWWVSHEKPTSMQVDWFLERKKKAVRWLSSLIETFVETVMNLSPCGLCQHLLLLCPWCSCTVLQLKIKMICCTPLISGTSFSILIRGVVLR